MFSASLLLFTAKKCLYNCSFDKNKMLGYCRDRAAGCVSFGQKWKTATGRQYLRTLIIGLSSTTVT